MGEWELHKDKHEQKYPEASALFPIMSNAETGAFGLAGLQSLILQNFLI